MQSTELRQALRNKQEQKKKPISQKTRPTARKADTLSDDRSRRFLSYFVLLGKLYLQVGPGTWTYSHRQKCWKASQAATFDLFFFLPSFTRPRPNVEEKFNVCTPNFSRIISKRENSLFLRMKMDHVKLCNLPNYVCLGLQLWRLKWGSCQLDAKKKALGLQLK